MRAWITVLLVLAVAPAQAQTEAAPVQPQDDAATRFDRMSEQEKAQLRERLREMRERRGK